MTERLTRSRTGKTPQKPEFLGMVETPARKTRARKSLFPANDEDERAAKVSSYLDDLDDASNGLSHAEGNGHTNGHMNLTGVSNAISGVLEETHRVFVNGSTDKSMDELKQDAKVNDHPEYEFGGAPGVSAMMIGFPLLMWYMWIGATYYDGGIPTRGVGQSWPNFFYMLFDLVYTGAFPHAKAWAMYWTFFVFEGICYLYMPGVYIDGKPLQHLGGKKLPYYCSAYTSFYLTIAIALGLHFSGIFPLQTILTEFGSLMSVAIISGYLVSSAEYTSAIWRGAQHQVTGSPVYDFFMGVELNPRLFGWLDFKMFYEVRIPWFILLFVSMAAAANQYDKYGYVAPEVAFLCMAHYLYANACAKGEELITQTWDMYHEKLGFMLTFWNMAGVPLSYCHCTLFLANHDPSEYKWNRWILGAWYVAYLGVYWVWDTCNSQKNRFRARERGGNPGRKTFPQLPYAEVLNPKRIPTSTGDSLLCDGWYGKARKVHYTCDMFFALSWAGITGLSSPYPWFYPLFFAVMIAHRAWRDDQKCRARYGKAWEEYCRRVPYIFIPGII
ncbi:delta(24(24(1)))-sterol reductase [Aulographum hederae CBS 113979]|uniref:Delta(24(24(1)))-sterol reductase n=1 Tax=Aulographum hederae CBS 113979 TaxID=1176131 RepID=A0A6G1HHC0_9PEZI|nr:delta(24(24(1)))-sterol reductase [Aulographum hederae CBS 113979]